MKATARTLSMLIALSAMALANLPATGRAAEKLTYHENAERSGWNPRETVLTPATVASARFGSLWQSPQLDAAGDVPPRLFASPLYLPDLVLGDGRHVAAAFVVSTAGYAYAISTVRVGALAPGAILWRTRLTASPCADGTMGNLSTPVIDRRRGRLYVSSCSGKDWVWHVHALDLRSGAQLPGWPVEISSATINGAGLNHNGTTQFVPGQPYLQRGALNLSPDGTRLYVAFGPDPQGWLMSLDTVTPRIASAFSTNPVQAQEQGGMWGSSGPAVDAGGRVYIATGASFAYALARRGIPGVFPDSPHSWGQSILQFTDRPQAGLQLAGSYTPYNYCQTAASDIDIAGSGAVVFDLPGASGTPHLLALGAGKQGNAYLLDRDHMPGGTVKRHACSTDPASDRSLLAPEVQPSLKTRGPVNVFGPFSDNIGMVNQAKSRSTLAHFRSDAGVDYLYLSGSSKTGVDFSTNVPPGLARVRVVTSPHRAAFLRIDRLEQTQTFQNPGSPIISSHGGRDGIVWLLDPNAPRSADPFQAGAVHPMLYAFDALSLKLLWTSKDALFPTGKYNEPTVADGLVLVGTDRLQAFGMRKQQSAPPVTAGAKAKSAIPVAAISSGQEVFMRHCAACHAATAGPAPALSIISRLGKPQLIEILTTGKMQPMANDLSPAQIEQVAAFVSAGGR